MRINKFLASRGLGSRRKVEDLVRAGRISVNGVVATNLATDIREEDSVLFDNKPIHATSRKYFAVYKPVGYTCTNSDRHAEKTLHELSGELSGLSIVGRLDRDSEGLVLLSNDGAFVQSYQHPSGGCEKEYLVSANMPRSSDEDSLEKLFRYFLCGALLDGYKTRPSKIKMIKREGPIVTFKIILNEGRKRQIRRIFEKVKMRVVSLKRVRIGEFCLEDLAPGEVRELLLQEQNA